MEFTFLDEPEEERHPPPYGIPGRLMFTIPDYGIEPYKGRERRSYVDLEVVDYDGDTSVFWLMENGFVDYWIGDAVELDQPGTYVLEGVVGFYYRGDGWTTDDDEDWSFERCRYATAEEIAAGGLGAPL